MQVFGFRWFYLVYSMAFATNNNLCGYEEMHANNATEYQFFFYHIPKLNLQRWKKISRFFF